jgi:hypothetical protein
MTVSFSTRCRLRGCDGYAAKAGFSKSGKERDHFCQIGKSEADTARTLLHWSKIDTKMSGKSANRRLADNLTD